MIIVLVGASASGKSTIEKLIKERNPSFSQIVSYTTRPMREGEKDGVDYHFITEDEFQKMADNDEFLELATYRGWKYGSAKKDYHEGENHVVVLTPHGCRSLKRLITERNINGVFVVYFKIDRRSRMIKILSRGDDIDEAYRRNLSDEGQFDGFEDEADFVIPNTNFEKSIEDVYKEIKNAVNENVTREREKLERLFGKSYLHELCRVYESIFAKSFLNGLCENTEFLQ